MPYVTYATNGIHFKVDNHQFVTYLSDFVFTIDTRNLSTGSSAANQFKLPLTLNGSYNMTVDWGDNSSNAITAYNQAETTHSYASQGVYTVKISGQCRGFRFNNSGDRLKILNIANWDTGIRLRGGTGSDGSYFTGCANLTITATDKLDLTGTTLLTGMFNGCASLTTAPTMALWDTSAVTDMSNMFNGCAAFNQPIGNWDMSNVGSMSYMFFGCTAFNQDIGGWNVSKVGSMSYMFSDCLTFNQNIGGWNVSNVINMSCMLRSTASFNKDIGSWNVSNVNNMSYMLYGAAAFNQNIGAWNVSRVIDFSFMFNSATVFNNGGADSMKNWITTAAIYMYSMFRDARVFNQPLNGFNMSNVGSTAYMFSGAAAFNNGGSNSMQGWDMSKMGNMAYMFSGAVSFKQNLSSWSPTAMTTANSMFYNVDVNATGTTANYDALLVSWAGKAVLNNVLFNGGKSKYSAAAAAARAHLTATHGWTITDGGLAA